MESENVVYHRQWIERIDRTVVELEKVRCEHEAQLQEALSREQKEEKDEF